MELSPGVTGKRRTRPTVPPRLEPLVPAPARENPIPPFQALEEEFKALHGSLPPDFPGEKTTGSERLEALFQAVHSLEKPRTGLCLSGGGIRSATFALGLLQGLARHRLLGLFDYLSTVSGGGYVGSWLSAWIARQGGDVRLIEKELCGADSDAVTTEPKPVSYLRAYSNFLTPRLGTLSADTWSLIATVLRNLVLNWLLLVPLVGAIVMVPRLWMMALSLSPSFWLGDSLLGLAVLLGALGFGYIALDMPSVGNRRGSQRRFLLLCLAPVAAAAFLVVTFWAWRAKNLPAENLKLTYVGVGIAFHLLAFVIAWIRVRRRIRMTFLLATPVVGGLGGLAVWTLAAHVFPDPADESLPMYAAFGPDLLLLLLTLLGALFVGITSRVTDDADREWWSRAGAWVLIAITVWTLAAAISLFGPNLPNVIAAAISSVGGLSGVAVAILGFRDDSEAGKKNGGKAPTGELAARLLLKLAAPTFMLALLVAVSVGSTALLSRATGALNLATESQRVRALLDGVGLFGALFGLAFLMSCFVDTNEFSLHSMYRNRLVRAYLGASTSSGSRADANPFTGFAKSDDLQVSALARRPFHVLNLTLNVVNANNLAWQERKAESFTVSPLHAGSSRLGYRPSGRYAGGISLGTAATISGAAASPNMGYHSSPAVTFLMTFFNARLGCWLGNPGDAGWLSWYRTGPRLALRPMVAEAFGKTDDRTPYVYLSDGGHFENLGLYEMVLRRCHLIVVSDAGCDSRFTFGDLGNAVRKIRIDLGIPIEFRGRTLLQTISGDEGKYGAVADIGYRCVDPGAEDGLLVYLKPSLNGTEPADIRNYKAMHPEFPHETTADQWFSESQFESYRMLGSHIIEEICGTVLNDLLAFGQQAESYLGPPPGPSARTIPAKPPVTA